MAAVSHISSSFLVGSSFLSSSLPQSRAASVVASTKSTKLTYFATAVAAREYSPARNDVRMLYVSAGIKGRERRGRRRSPLAQAVLLGEQESAERSEADARVEKDVPEIVVGNGALAVDVGVITNRGEREDLKVEDEAEVDVEKTIKILLEAVDGVKGRGREVTEEQLEAIERAIAVLEADGGIVDPVKSDFIEGRWQALFTSRPSTASPIQRLFIGVDVFRVFQEISLLNTFDPRVCNVVDFGKEFGELRVEAKAGATSGRRIDFQFDRAAFELKFWPYRLPYPVPFRLLGKKAFGWIDTTFLSQDGSIRISRGNRGTFFVLKKNPTARDKLLADIRANKTVGESLLDLVAENAIVAPARSPVLEGTWRLIWSSQASDANWLQRLTSNISNSYQTINRESSTLQNVVEILPNLFLRAEADIKTASDVRTDVYIRSAQLDFKSSFGEFSIPLPIKGEGFVEQLYLDQGLRISKGNKGSIFVHIRDVDKSNEKLQA